MKTFICSLHSGDEGRWASETFFQLKEDSIEANEIITDGDSRTFHAAERMHLDGLSVNRPKQQLCTRHVQSNQKKHIKAATFSNAAFPVIEGLSRKLLQGKLALDLSRRCQAEHVAAHKFCKGNFSEVKKKISKLVKCLPHCYQGDHSLCKSASFKCNGLQNDNWLTSSLSFFQDIDDFRLVLGPKDLDTFNKCVGYRLGLTNLSKLSKLKSTQKCEACNRSLTYNAPKHMTFSRNYKSRVASA